MAKRIIRLTESQLTRLIGRIVEDAEKDMEDMEMDREMESPDYEEEMEGEGDPIEMIAKFFEDEGINDLPQRKIDRIEDKIEQIESEEMSESNLYEDEDESSMRRRPSFASRMMKRGGVAMTATGLMGFVGNVMGWSEFASTRKLHELSEMLEMANYTGPISVAMIAAGIALALGGHAKEYKERNR
jgi:hypothetical protein